MISRSSLIVSSLLGLLGMHLLLLNAPITYAQHSVPLTPLTQILAEQRAKQISNVSYSLWIGVDAKQSSFAGRAVIRFHLKQASPKLVTLDFEEGTLNSIRLNGTELTDLQDTDRFDGHHIYFKTNELLEHSNQIEIAYTHPYSTNGNGLHRFQDPADQRIYLYTHFEPYDAHRLFPCFDQPDLKARLELTVAAPKDWTVISNATEREISEVDARKVWAFPITQPLSPYLFALIAGPYAVWESNANGIPTRLFARQSLKMDVNPDAKEWLEITKNGLDFFTTQFGYAYPFIKYDQILVPEFNAGAMENAGAVTFSERFIFRTPATQDRHRNRANTILHEMAHMWFGDLVTLKWWNGLWLNESFATFMAAWAVDEATSFKGSWQSFFTSEKQWAYWEDQLVTTHPIELPVSDTDQAEANFDGITYGKGASVLKQLRFLLGEDEFKDGVQRYFQAYAFRNTTLYDFMKMLSEASAMDLSQWQKSWLQTSGVNTVQAKWECQLDEKSKKSVIAQFTLLQSTTQDEPLRLHQMHIALYKQHKQLLNQVQALPLTIRYSAAMTPVPDAIGLPCPDFVMPNFNDHDYVKIVLDPQSLKTISDHLPLITGPLTRQMLWHTLWEMVYDGLIRAQDYADLVLKHIHTESSTQILAKILPTLTDPNLQRISVLKLLPQALKGSYLSHFEKLTQTRLQGAPAGSDLQLIWYQAFLNTATSPNALNWIRSLFNQKQKLKGFVINQERRWDLIRTLARNGTSDARKLIQSELTADHTDRGFRAAIAAEASLPQEDMKNYWFNQIALGLLSQTGTPSPSTAPSTRLTRPSAVSTPLSLSLLKEAMASYHRFGHEEWTRHSVSNFFSIVPKLSFSDNIEYKQYAPSFVRWMYPSLCDPNIIAQTTTLLDAKPPLPAGVIKALKMGRQEVERCIRAQQKALQNKTIEEKL